jgi:hypothetical protein
MRLTIPATAVLLAVALPVAAEECFIIGVAQRQGQDGAWWNTEVWITNTTAATGAYGVVFLPEGQNNAEGLRVEPVMEDLPPGATAYRNDLVPLRAAGALRFVTTPGVTVYARVFNAAGSGSFGEGIPALNKARAHRSGEIAHLVGLRRTPQFRTNVAFFDPSAEGGMIRLRLVAQSGEVVGDQSYRIAPGAYLQVNDVLHAFDVSRGENLRAEVSGTVPFFALASVVDARSGAPTLIFPPH